jgi:hypothetical protein
MNVRNIAVAGLALALSAGVASASQQNTHRVTTRESNQQTRIAKGAEHHQLSNGEVRRLEAREAAIRRQEARMKADGRLSTAEKRKLDHELSILSRRIRAEKHRA